MIFPNYNTNPVIHARPRWYDACAHCSPKMRIFHVGILIALVASHGGCASKQNKVTEPCAHFEIPSFTINFMPTATSTMDVNAFVDISEDTRGATIRIGWSQDQYRISDSRRYYRLKKRILNSHEWHRRVPELQVQSGFIGAPRDILIVRSGGEGICLQGSTVPRTWRDELFQLARTGKGTKVGEQAVSSNH